MINIILILALQFPTWQLKGPQKPISMIAGNKGQTLWIICQESGNLPQLFCTLDKKLVRLDLPSDTRYIIVHPEQDTLFSISPTCIFQWHPQDNPLVPTKLFDLDLPKQNHPTWLPGFFEENRFLLPFQNGILVLNYAKVPVIQQWFPMAPIKQKRELNNSSWLFPQVAMLNHVCYWTSEDTLFHLRGNTLVKSEFPSVFPMENQIPILGMEEPTWFIYGGNQGDLDSFGWRIKNGGIAEKGILTRFSQDPGADRICFTTVSNQVSSHLYSSLVGKRFFTLWVIEKKSGEWKIIQEKEFGLKKEDGLFGIFWPGDMNDDQLLDMVISDRKDGFRVYLSDHKSGFSNQGTDLGATPSQLFNLSNGFAWAYEGPDGFDIHWATGGKK